MDQVTFDPGLTQQYAGSLSRIINPDGKFNVRRQGVNWRDIHPYLYMINTSWPRFLMDVFLGYLVLNLLFASIYWLVGVEHLHGALAGTKSQEFFNAFFFSAHTLTTVGYGSIYPEGILANSIASLEALFGLMTFALATGLLFGRFSKPAARLGFSENILVAPYGDRTSLQFRIANRRSNNLMELEARVMLMTVENVDGELKRRYVGLTLERPNVNFLPLTWTVVHPIDEASPLWRKSGADLAALQAEFLILIKGFDDTFHQVLHTRHSYRHEEMKWDAKFAPAFRAAETGELILEIDRLGTFKQMESEPEITR